jgi:hypothetical protein
VQETTLEKKEFSYICLINSDALISAHTNEEIPFEVCKSVHHHMIQIIQLTRCNSFTSLLLDVYVWLNMFWESPCRSSGAYNCTRGLWFSRWREAVGALLIVVCQTTTSNAPTASLQPFNQWPLVQLYVSDDERGDTRNMLSHT